MGLPIRGEVVSMPLLPHVSAEEPLQAEIQILVSNGNEKDVSESTNYVFILQTIILLSKPILPALMPAFRIKRNLYVVNKKLSKERGDQTIQSYALKI